MILLADPLKSSVSLSSRHCFSYFDFILYPLRLPRSLNVECRECVAPAGYFVTVKYSADVQILTVKLHENCTGEQGGGIHATPEI